MVGRNKLTALIIICITVVFIAGIGAWVYVEQQKITQKNNELQQQKELTEFEQKKIDERAIKDRQCEQATANSSSPFAGTLSCR